MSFNPETLKYNSYSLSPSSYFSANCNHCQKPLGTQAFNCPIDAKMKDISEVLKPDSHGLIVEYPLHTADRSFLHRDCFTVVHKKEGIKQLTTAIDRGDEQLFSAIVRSRFISEEAFTEVYPSVNKISCLNFFLTILREHSTPSLLPGSTTLHLLVDNKRWEHVKETFPKLYSSMTSQDTHKLSGHLSLSRTLETLVNLGQVELLEHLLDYCKNKGDADQVCLAALHKALDLKHLRCLYVLLDKIKTGQFSNQEFVKTTLEMTCAEDIEMLKAIFKSRNIHDSDLEKFAVHEEIAASLINCSTEYEERRHLAQAIRQRKSLLEVV